MSKNQPHHPDPTMQSTDSDSDLSESDTSKPSPTEHSQSAAEPVASEQPETEHSQPAVEPVASEQTKTEHPNTSESSSSKIYAHVFGSVEKLDSSDRAKLKRKIEEIDHKEKKELFNNVHKKICDIIKSELKMSFDEYVNNYYDEKTPGQNKKTRSPNKSNSPPRPKYHNPDNPSQTWSGRGRSPKWVTAMEAKYGSRDAFLIPLDEVASESPKKQDQDQDTT